MQTSTEASLWLSGHGASMEPQQGALGPQWSQWGVLGFLSGALGLQCRASMWLAHWGFTAHRGFKKQRTANRLK